MMFPQVISGACLLALMIVQICCFPAAPKKAGPGASSGGSNPTSFAASYPYAEPSGHSSPGGVVYGKAPASVHSFQPAPAAAPVFSQPAGASVSSGALPTHAVSGGSPAGYSPPGFSQPSSSFPAAPEWSVPPPSGRPSGPSRAESVSYVSPPHPPLPPPEPAYQGGELSQYEQNTEDGLYETETEEQGYLPPPPPLLPVAPYGAESSFTSQPRPLPPFYGSWGFFPYYDYRFLYGQYPPGTYTHVSSDFEHGNDNWQDVHYERYDAPYEYGTGQQTETVTSGGAADPQRFQAPRPATYRGYTAAEGPSGYGGYGGYGGYASHLYQQPADPAQGHTGGSNVGKGN